MLVKKTLFCSLLLMMLNVSCSQNPGSHAVSKAKSSVPAPSAVSKKRAADVEKVAPKKKTTTFVKVVKEEKQYREDLRGFRTGMSMNDVKRLLHKKGIRDYRTDFSDLIVYDPAWDTEVKLFFTCGARWNVLSNAELTITFPSRDADVAMAAYRGQLVAKYGPPVRSDAGPGSMDLCWGNCEKSNGWKLEAKTTVPENGRMKLVTQLIDQSLVRACGERRPVLIDRWIGRWISDAQKYSLGMSLQTASDLYWRRYHEKLSWNEKPEDDSGEYPIVIIEAAAQEYFDGLDYDALYFEGAGPGTITLKFTGDQAGAKSSLNQRLFYSYFSTTKFKDLHLGGMQQKLERFIKVFGKPVETQEQQGRLSARWTEGTKQRQVILEDSGLLVFEQSDLALKDAYRTALIQYMTELGTKRYDKNPF